MWGASRSAPRIRRRASTTPLLLAPFSTRIPPELLDRLRVAAPQIGLHQSEIATIAIDAFLAEYGF